MSSIDPLPRLPVSWKEFSDLLRANQPNPLTKSVNRKVDAVLEVRNDLGGVVSDDGGRDHEAYYSETTEARSRGSPPESTEDPVKEAMEQLLFGVSRDPPPRDSESEGIDVLA